MVQRSFLRDISGVFSSNLLALGSAFLIDIVISRQLGPDGRGLYTSILVVPLIISSFVMLGIRRSAVYHLGQKVFDQNRTVSGILSLLILTSLLAVLLTGIALYFTMPKGLTIPMAVIALLSIPVKLLLVYTGGIYIGKEDFRRSNLQVWSPVFLNLVGVVLFVAFLHWSVTGALLALLLANLLVSLKSLLFLSSVFSIKLCWDKEIVGSLAKMGLVYALAVVVMQLNYRIDLLILQKLSTMKQVGYYSLGVSISDKLWQLPSAIGLVVMSRAANVTEKDVLDHDIARLLRVSFLIVLVGAIALWLLIPWLLPFFFGQKFIPSIAMVRLMLPGILMFVIARILSGRFAGAGEPGLLIKIFVPALFINILLNLLWVPEYGGNGAAMATNISYTLGAIGMLVAFSIRTKVPLMEIVRYKKSDFRFLKQALTRFRKR